MMTDTAGWRVARSVAGIRRIYYYSGVRRILRFLSSAALGFVLLSLSGCYSGTRPPRIGSAAPDFTVHDSDRTVTLSQLKGQVVVLNFWATWCPPCIEEMPSLVQMQQRMKAKGVTVLAVSVDVDQDNYQRFLKDHSVNLLSVRDADQIVTLRDGRITECGTHDELLSRGGYYSELYHKQLLEEELEAI